MASRKNVGGNAVRTWAKSDEGKAFLATWATENEVEVPTVGERGRFAEALVTAFHKANPKVRYEAKHVPTRQIQGVRETSDGRKYGVKVTATLAEVRDFAKAEGLAVGSRGRISQEVYAAFAARPKTTV